MADGRFSCMEFIREGVDWIDKAGNGIEGGPSIGVDKINGRWQGWPPCPPDGKVVATCELTQGAFGAPAS